MTLRTVPPTPRARRVPQAALGLLIATAVVLGSAGQASGATAYTEHLTIDAGSARRAVTEATLLAGHQYRLTVTGTYVSGDTVADAECTRDELSLGWQREAGGFDLLVAGEDVAWQPSSSDLFNCDSSTHEYFYRFTPASN